MKPIILLLIVTFFKNIASLPSGAPSQACNTFMPRHVDRMNGGFLSSQSSNLNPYTIRVSRMNFTKNTEIRVWVTDNRTSGETGYRGILLQARIRNAFGRGPQGFWKNPPRFMKLMTCTNRNDAITHTEVTNIKTETTVFEWKAPCDVDIGDIVFTATIAQTRTSFWPRVTSDVIQEMTSDGSGEEPTTAVECDENEPGSGVRNSVHFMSWTLVTLLSILVFI